MKTLLSIFTFSTALQEGRYYSGDNHIRRIKPFHRRNTFDHNAVFFSHVSILLPNNQCCAFLHDFHDVKIRLVHA